MSKKNKVDSVLSRFPWPLTASVIFLIGAIVVGAVYLFSTRLGLGPAGISSQMFTYSQSQSPTLLTQLPLETTGINFVNTLSVENQIKYAYNGAGVAAGDYDADGLVDIYLVSEETPSRLYRNLGGLRFEDVTEQAGLLDTTGPGGFGIGAYFADIDDDGDLDLFRTNWETSNRLFRNNGNGTFSDITQEAGVVYAGGSTTATFADYDRDGDLDFFVATYRPDAIENQTEPLQLQMVDGQIVVPDTLKDRLVMIESDQGGGRLRELGERDLLYRNDGNGVFTEVAQQAGIEGGYWGLSAIFADVDNDGWPDLYVTNDLWSPDTFYHNMGDGTFQLISPDMLQNTPWFSMGGDFADINNDGLNDYFVGDMISRDHTKRLTQHGGMDMSAPPIGFTPQVMRNSLYLNNGDGSFSDIAWLADVAASEWTWSAKFADMDLDGFVDLLITNGMVRDLMDSDFNAQAAQVGQTQGREAFLAFFQQFPVLNNPNIAFRNNGDLTFSDASAQWGFNTAVIGHGLSLADLDNDGDLDVVVNNFNENAQVYRNDASNHRLMVTLQGQTSNRFGIGAQVTLTTDQGSQTRIVTSSGGYLSSHQPVAVFGLGAGAQIQQLQVEWPSGHVQVFPQEGEGALTADSHYTIVEPASRVDVPPPNPLQPQSPWFVETAVASGITWAHTESLFDDFSLQKLLPRGLSQLGPGIAWADVNGDGWDDLTVAGANGQTAALYQNNGNGAFTDVSSLTPWRGGEGMSPLWLHVGGAMNLLVSNSTIENASLPLLHRYINNPAQPFALQDGGWLEASLASSSSLATADFDRDGDLDLFVGGRALPGRWPLAAPSRLYVNQNGTLADSTAAVAPDLQNLGLATGSLWADVDNDGDSDLVVATEWGAVRLLRNENGRLTDATTDSGLSQWTGLWTGITAGDYDHDGDLDLAAANLGLNTKYEALPGHPLTLFAGDVNGTGGVNIVETEWVGDTLFPLKERGMAGADMPFILEQFSTFQSYAQATLEQVYGERLAQLQRFEANTLTHMLFVNDGNGRFTAQPLPQLAQITAGFGITTADFDNDSHDDLYLVGNFSYADHETMMYSGGVSYWLKGNGDGTFVAVPSAESGLLVPYDGRGVAVADYDQDGWVDVAVGVNNHAPLLFRNQAKNANCAAQIRLIGPAGNPTGVGTRITVTLPNGTAVTREVMAGSGYLSQDSATLLFGLGTAEQATVTLRWPDGAISQPTSVQACQLVQFSR